ncbi:MAG: NUDIX domain-containing protein [Candidatus Saccharibacteria bacterium]|nr:NUDIX domain-containing protein [Candidatus Saccharibacteria bacterium]
MKTFHIGVKAIIVDQDKTLLLKTNEERGSRWEVPGGRIDDNESIPETLKRELEEEILNIRSIEVKEIVHVHRLQKDIEGSISLTLLFYEVTATFDGAIALSDEHVDYKWCTREEVAEFVQPELAEIIQKAFDE